MERLRPIPGGSRGTVGRFRKVRGSSAERSEGSEKSVGARGEGSEGSEKSVGASANGRKGGEKFPGTVGERSEGCPEALRRRAERSEGSFPRGRASRGTFRGFVKVPGEGLRMGRGLPRVRESSWGLYERSEGCDQTAGENGERSEGSRLLRVPAPALPRIRGRVLVRGACDSLDSREGALPGVDCEVRLASLLPTAPTPALPGFGGGSSCEERAEAWRQLVDCGSPAPLEPAPFAASLAPASPVAPPEPDAAPSFDAAPSAPVAFALVSVASLEACWPRPR